MPRHGLADLLRSSGFRRPPTRMTPHPWSLGVRSPPAGIAASRLGAVGTAPSGDGHRCRCPPSAASGTRTTRPNPLWVCSARVELLPMLSCDPCALRPEGCDTSDRSLHVWPAFPAPRLRGRSQGRLARRRPARSRIAARRSVVPPRGAVGPSGCPVVPTFPRRTGPTTLASLPTRALAGRCQDSAAFAPPCGDPLAGLGARRTCSAALAAQERVAPLTGPHGTAAAVGASLVVGPRCSPSVSRRPG